MRAAGQGPQAMPSEGLPSVTVIIPTKNRPSDLEFATRSLFEQTVPAQQLIIIDQSEGPESRQRIERQHAQLPGQLRERLKLCYVHDSSIRGLTQARNRSMELAESDVWLFLDDDVYLEPNFLEEVLTVYAREPEVTGVSGIITNYRPPPWSFRSWLWLFARGPFRDERQPIYWKADHLRDAGPIAVGKLGGGLMSFRSTVIRDLRFDDQLAGVPEGEEWEFCARLPRGARLVIAPRARLVHKKSPTARPIDYWLERFAFANFYLYYRVWRGRPNTWVYLAWLTVGCVLVAARASVRRFSLAPWRNLLTGMRAGAAARRNAQPRETPGL